LIRLLLGFAWLAAAGIAAPAGAWRPSPRDIREPVRAVVVAQLAALQQADFAAAYAQAAAALRRQFPPDVFAAMIRRGYPGLLRHQRAEPGLVRDDQRGRAWVDVTVTPAHGDEQYFRYWLVREAGEWRVEGVVGRAPPADRL
jgi:acyl-CoA reductase-like NAD-dependent aldehyde dehydrogenase